MELLKTKTSDKPRRAWEAAAAARFFDDDARNLYGAYLREVKRKYAPHVPEAYLMVAREISGVRAKKIPQMRHFCGAAQPNKSAGVFIWRQGSVSGAQQKKIPQMRKYRCAPSVRDEIGC